jgi:hypothetical protein
VRITWPDKYPGEDFRDGVNWVDRKDTDTVLSTTFEVLTGDVILSNAAVDPDNDDIWKVKVSEGTPGIQEVLCTAELAGGDTLDEIAEFRVLPYPAVA